jgi:hypothetical protein
MVFVRGRLRPVASVRTVLPYASTVDVGVAKSLGEKHHAPWPIRLAWLAWLSSSCGGAPAAPQAPAAAVASAAPVVLGAPDVGAVADPSSLFLFGRLAKPSATLATLRDWSKLPMPQADDISEFLTGEAVGMLVDIDEPVDFAIGLVGSGMRLRNRSAVSVALKDADRAKAVLGERFKLVPGEGGALLMQGLPRRGDPRDGEGGEGATGGDGEQRSCEIAPAFGPSPTRLVCGWGTKALAELGPWLTRTATRAATQSELHVELRMLPLRQAIAPQKRLIVALLAGLLGSQIGLPGARAPALSVCGDLVDFLLDADSAAIDVRFGDAGATVTANTKLSTMASTVARLATAFPERNGPAPDAFWRLPADTDFALFERGIDDAALARGRDLALKMVADALGEYGLKERDRAPIVDALSQLATSAPLIYASGLDVEAAKKSLSAVKVLRGGVDPTGLSAAELASAEALLGWRVLEIDEPSTRWTSALKDLGLALGSPAVVAAYRAKAGAYPANRGAAPAIRSAPIPGGVTGLAAAALHDVLEVYPIDSAAPAATPVGSPGAARSIPAAPRRPFELHVFVVPDGARTWVGLGGDEVLVASKLSAAMGAGGEKIARAGLLVESNVGAGGILTLRGLIGAAMPFASLLASPPTLLESLEEPAALRDAGRSALVFSVAHPPSTPTTVTLSLHVPRAAVEDVVAVVVRHGGL